MGRQLRVATFWLLDMPSVALAVINGYIVLFAVRLVFRRRWPGTTSDSGAGVLRMVFVAFCSSLVVLVTLVAISRADRDTRALMVPPWMTFGYSVVVWTALGLLMLKYWGQVVQILWRHRRRNQWNAIDREETSNKASSRLPVLGISCLKSLAICSTVLAELMVVRGILCIVAASQHEEETVEVTSWRSITLHYFGWEIANVLIILRMLHQTPIAVHSFNEKMGSAGKASMQRSEAPSAPDFNDGEVQIRFEVPRIRELVTDYIAPSNTPLVFARRRGLEHERTVENRYCSVHHTGTPSEGAEYVSCRCCRDIIENQFLSKANVPLLAEEHEFTDESSC
ncbi:unnamed protein product [Phytophthora fragariaefolia]|uniref:Unnamed protein product n=1 Tax=Phytophthora fragariaefolia TaxID=1490495 RepID=A0A9W6YRF0_9STRA|nr:unnamed protein product [Phytophthora fragariaefolia]